jgi:hypothetical protein
MRFRTIKEATAFVRALVLIKEAGKGGWKSSVDIK